MRDVLVDDADDGDVLVQDVVEVDVAPQGERGGLLVRVGEDGQAGHAGDLPGVDHLDEVRQWALDVASLGVDRGGAARQVSITSTTMLATSSGSQPPWTILARLARKNTNSTPRMSVTATMIFQGATRHTNPASIKKMDISSSRVPVTARP